MKAILPNSILQGDCLDLLHDVPDKSVNLILADNPYAMTSNGKDIQIPLFDHFRVLIKNKEHALSPGQFAQLIISKTIFTLLDDKCRSGLWRHYKRVLADNGTIALFAKGKFAAQLMLHDPDFFKYEIIWNKVLTSNQLNAKNMPLTQHEMILIFTKSIEKSTYNPRMREGPPLHGKGRAHMTAEIKNQNYGKVRPVEDTRKGSTEKYPTTIWTHAKPHPAVAKHRTEKPVALLTELVQTYSNPGDIVLDNAAGSMGVGIACIDTKRGYILMEKDPEEFRKGEIRVYQHIDKIMDEA